MSDYPPPPQPPGWGDQPPPPPPPPPGPPPPAAPYGGYQQQPYGYQQQPGGYGYPPSVPYAGFWQRFAAVIIDGILLGIVDALLRAIFGLNAGNLLGFIIGIGYYAYLEGTRGQTVGKMALSIKVVDQDTWQPGIGIGRGIGRYFARFLSAIVFLLGYLWMLWDDRKQTWHDKLVRTVVVKA